MPRTHTVKNYSTGSEEGHASETSSMEQRLLGAPVVLSFMPTHPPGLNTHHREPFHPAAAFRPLTDP